MRRRGFTLIELLVVIAIVAVLLGMLMPAIQKVRMASAQAGCLNNMRQIGLGLHGYHDRTRAFPPGRTTTAYTPPFNFNHGWAAHILPFIEQDGLSTKYDWESHWTSVNNRAARRTWIPILGCPTLRPDRTSSVGASVTYPAAVSDYAPTAAAGNVVSFLGLTAPYSSPATNSLRAGVLETNRTCKITEIYDGTSNTIMIAEVADRPNRWQIGVITAANVTGAGWAAADASFEIDGTDSATATAGSGGCVINCTNGNEIWSMHAGGANVVFADGSARLLSRTIAAQTILSLVTRRGSDSDLMGEY